MELILYLQHTLHQKKNLIYYKFNYLKNLVYGKLNHLINSMKLYKNTYKIDLIAILF